MVVEVGGGEKNLHYQKEPNACRQLHKQDIFLGDKGGKGFMGMSKIFLKYIVTAK